MAGQYQVELIGQLPLELAIRQSMDEGRPTLVSAPDSPAAALYRQIARKVAVKGRGKSARLRLAAAENRGAEHLTARPYSLPAAPRLPFRRRGVLLSSGLPHPRPSCRIARMSSVSPVMHSAWLIALAGLLAVPAHARREAPVPRWPASSMPVWPHRSTAVSWPKRSVHWRPPARLPDRFVTKRQAREAGWQPGKSLWQTDGLAGDRLAATRFGNREHRLPAGRWQADLDYRGGKRNAKRLVFAGGGRRFVAVDHYQSFREVPPCR